MGERADDVAFVADRLDRPAELVGHQPLERYGGEFGAEAVDVDLDPLGAEVRQDVAADLRVVQLAVGQHVDAADDPLAADAGPERIQGPPQARGQPGRPAEEQRGAVHAAQDLVGGRCGLRGAVTPRVGRR